jgi:hypothetical protein
MVAGYPGSAVAVEFCWMRISIVFVPSVAVIVLDAPQTSSSILDLLKFAICTKEPSYSSASSKLSGSVITLGVGRVPEPNSAIADKDKGFTLVKPLELPTVPATT